MLRPQKFEFDARDQMPDAGRSLYSVLHPPSSALHPPFPVLRPPTSAPCPLPSALEGRSTCPNTSSAPRPPHATPEFFLHASAHRLRTDTGIPTPSTSPHPTAKRDILFVSSYSYHKFVCCCFFKERLLAPTFLIPILTQQFLLSIPDDCLFSKIFHPRKRGKMAILGP